MLSLLLAGRTREPNHMNAVPSSRPQIPGNPTSGPVRALFADAFRFWELRRLYYNAALLIVVAAWIFVTWPHFRPALTWNSLLIMSVLALFANVLYCAAYLVDIPLQSSPFGKVWRNRRWMLWTLGTIFAILLANYWIGDEIYPFVESGPIKVHQSKKCAPR